MEQLIIKVGEHMDKDLREVFLEPKKAVPGTHTLYLKNLGELQGILSPKRLELLIHLIKNQEEKNTVSKLAKELKRKQEAISRDSNILVKHNLIKKIKEKQMVYIKALYKSLNIQLS
ncbi:MAG: hypothetical protein AB1467_04435 [Candidatus Diapherotrites archaeon]